MLAGATTTSSSFVTGLTNEVSTTRRRGNTPGPSKDILQQCYNFDSTRYGDAGRQKQKRNKHGNWDGNGAGATVQKRTRRSNDVDRVWLQKYSICIKFEDRNTMNKDVYHNFPAIHGGLYNENIFTRRSLTEFSQMSHRCLTEVFLITILKMTFKNTNLLISNYSGFYCTFVL